MWEAFEWKSGEEMKYLKAFAFSIGRGYQDLVPLADLVVPNKTHEIFSYEGWAYCARTPDKNIFLAYFEKGCPQSEIRSARPNSFYRAQWFDPRKGTWIDIGNGKLAASNTGVIKLPAFPADADWGLKLIYERPNEKDKILPTILMRNESGFEKLVKKYWRYVVSFIFMSALIAFMALPVMNSLRKK
jgi:hypothetical protein